MTDIDADAIRNRRAFEGLQALMPHIPKLVEILEAVGGAAHNVEAKAQEHFDLGNRVEDGLKKLEGSLRVADDLREALRDMLQQSQDAATRCNAIGDEMRQALEQHRAVAMATPDVQLPAEAPPETEQPPKEQPQG